MISRLSVAAALVAAVCTVQSVTWGAADAQSLYQNAIKMQIGDKIDLKAAQDLLEQAAAAGSGEAMQRLGDMYHDGDGGVTKDYPKSIEWYKKEAALNDSHPGNGAMGMIALGEMYQKGKGVPQDKALADEWFAKALATAKIGADKGDTMAMTALAYCLALGKGSDAKADAVTAWAWAIKSSQKPNPWAYELIASLYAKGIGVKADPSAAISYELRAAQLGVSRAMVDVSLSYATGSGVKKNDKTAVEWIKKAVERGDSRAMGILGKFNHEEIGMPRSDLAAKDLFEKAIKFGDEASLGYMGDMFIMPGANPRDVNTAVTWFEKGAAVGDAYSMFQLAKLLTYDSELTTDVNRAMTLFTRAASLGYADALSAMGELYRDGKVRGTLDDRIAFFRKAAEAGSIPGMRNLGESLILKGEGTNVYKNTDDDKKLTAEGFDWLKKAADAGDLEAITDVGDAYLKGKGVIASPSTAITWYRKSATAGHVRAMRNLGRLYASESVVANYDEAKKWFEKGVEKNDPACMSGLAELYDNAQGVKEDNLQAFDLYQRAMKGGDGGGYRGLAQYLAAAGDYRQAAAYFLEAVNRDDMKAMEALGRMFELGQGVDKDMAAARMLFTRASDMGSQSAWFWVFSHTDFSATASATGSSRPPMLNIPDRTGILPPRRTTDTAPATGRGR